MSIEVRHLTKRFGSTVVCDDLSLDIPSGELVALLGPSGSGKTTLLRMIAGLERPDVGSVLFHGVDATDADVRSRRVGFVFQHYALFGQMTVFENVAFGLSSRRSAPRSPNCWRWCSWGLSPSAIRTSSPAASASASRSPARSRSSRRCCCSTSLSARSTPRCERNSAAGCATCTTRCT